jgi:glycosyltransferase involved in cell wall biosynthesis
MKIAIDAQLAVGTATGIGEYVRGLIGALRQCGTDEIVELSEPLLDPWRFDRRVFWDQVLLPQRARQSGAQLLHCASGTVPMTLAMPLVVTVHDVAWLRVQAHTRPYARYYFGKFSLERYRGAAAIVVDSSFSRQELLDVAPSLDSARVHVVYPGVASDFCALERSPGDRQTILVAGTVERRKNIEMVIKALPLVEGARLISVGPYTPYRDQCEEIAKRLNVAERVEFRGYVSRNELLNLYATSAVVAVPSQYEGFGYGAAQALCAGTPVIVADTSSLPEVVRDDARTVPVDNVQEWGEALCATLRGDDDARAAAARERSITRFAWSASAQAMQHVYASVSPEQSSVSS